jgi:cobalt/nickel transport system permease protein
MALARASLKAFEDIIYVKTFSGSHGLLQGIEPRVKICCAVGTILTAVTVRTITPLFILLGFAAVLCIASMIPLRFFLIRTLVFIPIFSAMIVLPVVFTTPGTAVVDTEFAGFVLRITAEGLYRAVQFTLRVTVCVATLTLLVLTTGASRLFNALRDLRFPSILVLMTSVTYRFIFLLIDEANRMLLARDNRAVGRERLRGTLRSLSSVIATLIVRAYDRGERVYLAMKSRGYSGGVKSLHRSRIQSRDWLFVGTVGAVCLISLSVEYMRLGG